jgi:hypothetical protein
MTGPSELVWLDFLFAQICSLKHARVHPAPEALGLHRG